MLKWIPRKKKFLTFISFDATSYPCCQQFIIILLISLSMLVGKGDVPLSDIVDQQNRTAWITEKVNLAKSQFMDGINLDIEQQVSEGSPEYYALTALVKESTEAFHREIPGSQVNSPIKTCFMGFFPQLILGKPLQQP